LTEASQTPDASFADARCQTPDASGTGLPLLASGVWRLASAKLGLLLLLALLTTGCSTRFVRGRAERRIADKLEDLIGPAEKYKVRVRGTKDAEIVVGRIRRVEIDGWNIQAGGQIELESLHAELRNLRYHAPPEERVSVGDSLLVVQLTQTALNDYLRRQQPDSQPEVVLNDGTVTLKGMFRWLGVPTPIETTGRLTIVDRVRLEFRAETVRVAADPMSGIGAEYIEKRLNPLLDVQRLNLPIRLDTITSESGRLVVRGTAHLPAPPRNR
jgi:hypothetical protein